MYYVEKRRKRQRIDGEKKIEDEVMLGGYVQMHGENISYKKRKIERGKEDRRKTIENIGRKAERMNNRK